MRCYPICALGKRSRRSSKKGAKPQGDSNASGSFVEVPTLDEQARKNAELAKEYAANVQQMRATAGGELLAAPCYDNDFNEIVEETETYEKG